MELSIKCVGELFWFTFSRLMFESIKIKDSLLRAESSDIRFFIKYECQILFSSQRFRCFRLNMGFPSSVKNSMIISSYCRSDSFEIFSFGCTGIF